MPPLLRQAVAPSGGHRGADSVWDLLLSEGSQACLKAFMVAGVFLLRPDGRLPAALPGDLAARRPAEFVAAAERAVRSGRLAYEAAVEASQPGAAYPPDFFPDPDDEKVIEMAGNTEALLVHFVREGPDSLAEAEWCAARTAPMAEAGRPPPALQVPLPLPLPLPRPKAAPAVVAALPKAVGGAAGLREAPPLLPGTPAPEPAPAPPPAPSLPGGHQEGRPAGGGGTPPGRRRGGIDMAAC